MVDLRSVTSHAAGLLGVGIRSLLGTVLVFLAVGLVLGAGSYYFLREHFWYGVGMGCLTVVQSLAVGIFLGIKRGFIMVVTRGLSSLRLGRGMVRVLFERLLAISEKEDFGDRGGRVAQWVERLPLAQAEQRLNAAVSGLVKAPPTGGGLTGRLRSFVERRLLFLVAKLTLARFRMAGAQQGGVNLIMLQAELENQIDELLVLKLRTGLNLWTVLVALGLPLAVALETWLVLALLQARS